MTAVVDPSSAAPVRHSPTVSRLSAVWDSETSLAGSPATRQQVSVWVEQMPADSSSGETAGPDLDQVPTAFSTPAGVVHHEAAVPAVSLLPLVFYDFVLECCSCLI